MKKLILTLLLAVCIVTVAGAQDYKTGIGLRLGLYNGLTIKHFFDGNDAIEGLLTTRWGGFEVVGLYEVHHPAFNTSGLKWYYGVGANVGFYGASYPGGSETVVGIDGVLGMEYSFKSAPINLSLDWKPQLNLVGYSHFFGDGLALSIRYILK